MGCLVVGLVLVASFVALTIALLASAGGGQWTAAFQHVARRFHGTMHSGGLCQTSYVWLRHGEAQARLTIASLPGDTSQRCVQFTIQQPVIAARCEIVHRDAWQASWPIARGLASM